MSTNPKVNALVLTLFLIGVMVAIGPVQALTLSLISSATNIVSGDKIEFIANVNLEEDKDVNYIVLDLAGPLSVACVFDIEGNNVTSCIGISIERIDNDSSTPGYGYGYGYGYGEFDNNLTYKITVDTTNYPTGIYSSNLVVLADDEEYSIEGEEIEISSSQASLQRCSVRAEDGEGNIMGEDVYSRVKLNFNIPSSKAVNGKGSLISQGNERFSYSYSVVKVLENKKDEFTVRVEGDYKIGRGQKEDQTATITVNRKTKTAEVHADDFDFEDLDVTLIKGC